MKLFLISLFTLFNLSLNAQVGIGTSQPNSTLVVTGQPNVSTSADGIIAPKISKQNLANKASGVYTIDHIGAIVYVDTITNVNSGSSINQVSNIKTLGYYYFDGQQWQPIVGDTTNDAWINDNINSRLHLSSTSSGTTRSSDTDIVVKDDGQLGIGIDNPSAKLHVNGGVKISTLPKAENNSTPVYWNSSTGELLSYENLKKPFNRIKYSIQLTNSDWVSDLNTNINSTNYTIIITSASFKYVSGSTATNPAFGIGHTNYSNGEGNPTANVYPFISGNTWRIYADYPNAAPLSSINGQSAIYQWDFDVMIIDNNTVKILQDKSNTTPQTGTTWSFSTPSDL